VEKEIITVQRIHLSQDEGKEAVRTHIKQYYGPSITLSDDQKVILSNMGAVVEVPMAAETKPDEPEPEALDPEQLMADLEKEFDPSQLEGD